MRRSSERGQTFVVIATMLGTMVLFAGLSVDLGTAYVTKARMARAADAASMVAMRNLSHGQGVATQAARDTFAANFKAPADQARPTVNVTYKTESGGNTRVSVAAASQIKTAFVGVIPAFKTLTIGASAEAVRSKLIMSLVLDRSGSMVSNGGWASLAPAVTDFIDRFDESMDRVAMVTFATTVRTDVALQTLFKTPINTKVPSKVSDFEGETNSVDGLRAGHDEMHAEDGDDDDGNVTRVMVFFTDGGADLATEARLAALDVAKDMRDDDITVFSVGLGGDAVAADLLREVANEPGSAKYDANAPSGRAFFPQDANELSGVFQTIATKILVRLNQ